MRPTHVIQSGYMTEGLFGQLLAWCLEVLPYLDKQDLKPGWRVLSRNYGAPPTFNIFPGVVELRYEPDQHDGPTEIMSLERLRAEVGHPVYGFQTDFPLAQRLFAKYFVFPNAVTDAVERFFTPFAGHRILGLHYRGTDKLVDRRQSNRISAELLLRTAQDLIERKNDVELAFLASDEDSFIAQAAAALPVPVVSFGQRRKVKELSGRVARKRDHEPLFRGHDAVDNTEIGRCAVIDSLLLSRCDYILKGQSALSGWSKVWNPELEAYRVAAFKHDWFPDAFIPPYETEDPKLRSALAVALRGELSIEEKLKLSTPVSTYLAGA